MANEIQSLLPFCAEPNLGGYRQLSYVPTHWIDTATYDDLVDRGGKWLKAISFEQGDWLTLPVQFTQRQWEQTQTASKQGNPYDNILQGVIQNMKPSVSVELEKMSHLAFLVRLLDYNNQSWLIGTLESPLRFRYQQLTGGGINESKNYRFRFFSESAHTAYEYAPIA